MIDGRNLRATQIDLLRIQDGSKWLAQIVALQAPAAIVEAVWMADGSLLAELAFSKARFAIFRENGELLGYAGEAPSGRDRDQAALLLHYERIAAHPDLTRLVTASRWYPKLEILGPEGEIIGIGAVPVQTEPVLISADYGLTPSEDSPNVYGDMATSRDYIFALYCGRTGDRHGAYQNFGRDVHVFDWGGNLVTVLRLDRDAFALEVDEANGRLFTVEHDPVPSILRYDLPPILRQGHDVDEAGRASPIQDS